jgi:hypothetical protein
MVHTYITRSEDVDLYQVTIPNDDAWFIMNELGNVGTVAFLDLNKHEQPFHLPYVS